MCVGGVGGGGVGGLIHVFCKNFSPPIILNPHYPPPCCCLGHIYPHPVADTHDQIHYTLTQLPSQRGGGIPPIQCIRAGGQGQLEDTGLSSAKKS